MLIQRMMVGGMVVACLYVGGAKASQQDGKVDFKIQIPPVLKVVENSRVQANEAIVRASYQRYDYHTNQMLMQKFGSLDQTHPDVKPFMDRLATLDQEMSKATDAKRLEDLRLSREQMLVEFMSGHKAGGAGSVNGFTQVNGVGRYWTFTKPDPKEAAVPKVDETAVQTAETQASLLADPFASHAAVTGSPEGSRQQPGVAPVSEQALKEEISDILGRLPGVPAGIEGANSSKSTVDHILEGGIGHAQIVAEALKEAEKYKATLPTAEDKAKVDEIVASYLRNGADFSDFEQLKGYFSMPDSPTKFDTIMGLGNLVAMRKKIRDFYEGKPDTLVAFGFDGEGKPLRKKWSEMSPEEKDAALGIMTADWIAAGPAERAKMLAATLEHPDLAKWLEGDLRPDLEKSLLDQVCQGGCASKHVTCHS